ncbi:MAG: deoxynucleoside kinase [Bacteroidetes bacterium B1(2017)]|nr:MAG: deoxynucleoside kinase [Bacteroidetes bacterium B1(2017)]
MSSSSPYSFIAIEGNIGSGKSSLANLLARDWGGHLIMEEFEDNSFLPKFYEDSRRYAFPLEMSFLAARFNQLKKQLPEQELFRELVISDYIFAKCLLFSKVNLDEDEYELYYKMFDIINQQLPKPELLIYLHSPVEKLQWNINNRGRSYEQKIEDQYLLNLQQTYFDYLHTHTEQRVLLIDCSNIDFVNNEGHYQQIKELACKEYEPGIHHYHILDL